MLERILLKIIESLVGTVTYRLDLKIEHRMEKNVQILVKTFEIVTVGC